MTRRTRERDPRLGDALIDLYVEWREECSAVHLAYERWCKASKDDRAAAFTAYHAALDREERAGNMYAAVIRHMTHAAPQRG
jgi:urease accessory protein UreF